MVATIGRIITKLNQMPGTRMNFSLGRKGMEQLAKGTQFDDALKFLLSGAKKPQVDVALKSSEQGFTVAAMTFRDGKDEIVKLAASITGHGTADEVIKMRANGLNGIMQARAHQYMALSPNVDDIALSVANKNGVMTMDQVCANGESHITYKTKELVEKFGGPGSYDEGVKKVNGFLNNFTDKFRKLLSGETVSKVKKVNETVEPKKFKSLDEIFEKTRSGKPFDKTHYQKETTAEVKELLNKADEIEQRVKIAENLKYENSRKTPEGAKQALEQAIKYAKERGIDIDDIVKI